VKKLLSAGYGFKVKVTVVSEMGVHRLNYWGFACPLWWISPSYGIDTIFDRGAFGSRGTQKPVIGQANTLEKLEESLLESAYQEFPEPFKLPNAADARQIYPSLYQKED
jgi:hypothetical protein